MVCRISLLLNMALLLIRLLPQTRRMITARMMARTLISAARSQNTRAASNLTTKHEYGVSRRLCGHESGHNVADAKRYCSDCVGWYVSVIFNALYGRTFGQTHSL